MFVVISFKVTFPHKLIFTELSIVKSKKDCMFFFSTHGYFTKPERIRIGIQYLWKPLAPRDKSHDLRP